MDDVQGYVLAEDVTILKDLDQTFVEVLLSGLTKGFNFEILAATCVFEIGKLCAD